MELGADSGYNSQRQHIPKIRSNWSEKDTICLAKIYREMWMENVALGKKDRFVSDRPRCNAIRQKLLQVNIDRSVEQIHTKINNLKSCFHRARELDLGPGTPRSVINRIMSPSVYEILLDMHTDKESMKINPGVGEMKGIALSTVNPGMLSHTSQLHDRSIGRMETRIQLGDGMATISGMSHQLMDESNIILDHSERKKRKTKQMLQGSLQATSQSSEAEENDDYQQTIPMGFLHHPMDDNIGLDHTAIDADDEQLDNEGVNSHQGPCPQLSKRRKTEKLLQYICDTNRALIMSHNRLAHSMELLTKSVIALRETQIRQHQEVMQAIQYSGQQINPHI